MAKRRGSEIFNFVFNLVCRNFLQLGDSECLLFVHNMVWLCVCVMWYVCV